MNQEEFFVLPVGDDRYYLYAPLRRGIAVVNGAAAAAVSSYLQGEQLSAAQQGIIDQLGGHGLLGADPPAPPVFPEECTFAPYEVTLFLTTRCNLRCTYCYAEAGKRQAELSWDAARAAIDLVLENAALAGREDFMVGFHGGGEPTLCWEMIQRCTDYAHQQATARGLQARVHAATNGLLNAEQRAYIAEHFSGLNISLDGPAEIQDRQRPRAGGGGSFDAVMESLRDFDRRGFRVSVRATVTEQSVHRMLELVQFFATELPHLERLHLEPAWYCGRCRTSGEQPPAQHDFADQFERAAARARELDLPLIYSGARVDALTSKFCAAPGDGFSITPDGAVTSCYEILDADDPRAPLFHYGRFDPERGVYQLDEQRQARLRRLSVEHLPHCQDCFCRWHCAGDCLAKSLQTAAPESHNGSARCEINRRLTMAELHRMVRRTEQAQQGQQGAEDAR